MERSIQVYCTEICLRLCGTDSDPKRHFGASQDMDVLLSKAYLIPEQSKLFIELQVDAILKPSVFLNCFYKLFQKHTGILTFTKPMDFHHNAEQS